MNAPHWIEKPRALALLTLAFALVPVAVAVVTFRTAQERDAKLYQTAAEVLGEQFKIITLRHINFLALMRNQWRYLDDPADPPRNLPPAGWEQRVNHLHAVAYASHDDEQHILIRWKREQRPQWQVQQNLATNAAFAEVLRQARMTSAPLAFGVQPDSRTLFIIEAVTDANDSSLVRGYLLGSLDLAGLCRDAALPLIQNESLRAVPVLGLDSVTEGTQRVLIGDSELKATWTAAITRGPGFSREYGTPTPWLGFAGLALSALPLSVLVMLAARAGKLRAALDAERELVSLKTHFLHSVSHEFRTPLSVIQSGAELIEHYANQLSPERRSQALAQIKNSAQHMNEMVEQVLTLSRIESQQMPLQCKLLNAAALAHDIAQEMRAATQERCVIVVEAKTTNETWIDPALLRGVLINLLTNAVKYSTPDSTVTLSLANDEQQIIYRVRDHGIGIPATDMPSVQQAFQRGSNTGQVSGTGLGLAIASKCAALHGGTLSIASTEGQGTTVTFTVPHTKA